MMEFLRRTWEQIAAFFRRMPVPNRVALGALTAALVAVLALFLSMGTKDSKVPLVWEHIDLAQGDAVRKNLQDKGIPFEIRGDRIYVQPDQKDSLLMQLYGEGVFQGDDAFYKWVFEHDITETRGGRELKWIVSRQNALAKMISSLDAVENAMVTITQQKDVYFENQPRMNAAVKVKLKAGKSLGDDTVLGIAKWVAFSVQGMKPQDVAIMDTAGTMYPVQDASSNAASALSIQKNIVALEKYVEEKVKRFLVPLYGNQIGVLSRVLVDFDEEHRHQVGPKDAIEKFLESESIHETNTTLGGEPGVGSSNTGGATGTPVIPTGGPTSSTTNEKTVKKSRFENDYPKEDIERIKAVGTVKTISMVIAAPYERLLRRPNGTRAGYDEKGELKNLTEADDQVKKAATELKKDLAIGLQLEPKDIEIIPSYIEPPAEPEKPTTTQKALWFAEQHWTKIGLALLSLVALFLIWRVLRSAAPDEIEQELEKLRADLKAAEPPAEEEVLVPAGEEKAFEMKERIRDVVRQNPRNAAGLLKRWITKP